MSSTYQNYCVLKLFLQFLAFLDRLYKMFVKCLFHVDFQ